MHDLGLPTPLHAQALAQALDELKRDANVLGIMLIGSLARGAARPDSDIDLVVVQAHGSRVVDRRSHGALVVERNFRTLAEWETHFTPTRVGDESWGYAFLRPKMEAVLQRGDATEIGWAAAVMTHPILQTVWAVNNLPLPSLGLGSVQRHLDDLTVPAGVSELVRKLLQESPEPSLRLQLQIVDAVTPLLQTQAGA